MATVPLGRRFGQQPLTKHLIRPSLLLSTPRPFAMSRHDRRGGLPVLPWSTRWPNDRHHLQETCVRIRPVEQRRPSLNQNHTAGTMVPAWLHRSLSSVVHLVKRSSRGPAITFAPKACRNCHRLDQCKHHGRTTQSAGARRIARITDTARAEASPGKNDPKF